MDRPLLEAAKALGGPLISFSSPGAGFFFLEKKKKRGPWGPPLFCEPEGAPLAETRPRES